MKLTFQNKLSGLILFMMMLFCSNVSAQNITVSGSVVDSEKEPLIGASVSVVGGKVGAITDLDGKFSIECKQGDMLEVSYIGYTTRKVQAAKDLKVVLEEDAKKLDEVTVVGVGYGKMRKSDLTGAIASVSSKDMKQGVITSTEQLLQGKVAGLSIVQSSGAVESGASIRLRGGTSLSASNGPLVVVDGIPGVDINSVQSSEIVSMDILKDASAAAIYGSRGANGVIIITTNRQGTDTEVNTIQYNGYVAFASAARKLDVLSANQWRSYVRSTGNMSALDFGASTDWQDELMRTAVSHSHNINFSSSKKNHGYRASFTYNNNEGVIKTNTMNRLAGSLSAYQTGLNGHLKLDEGINTNFDSWHPIDSRIFERMINLQPTFPVYNSDGTYAQLNGTNTENPVELNNHRTEDRKRHRFLGYMKAELQIIDGLSATMNTSYEFNSVKSGLYKPTYARMEGQSEKGWGQRLYDDYTNKQLEFYLTYDKKFADIHHLNLMGGYSYLDNIYEGFSVTRSGYDSDAFGYNNLGAGSDYRQGDAGSYKGGSKLISFFGRVNYSLLDRYMLTATLRRDGSSRFGENHKWGVFPSVSFAWRISEEPFMASTREWLDNLKLRAGFGVTGNQNGIGEYKSLSILSAAGSAYYDGATNTWKNSYTQIQNPNPDLKWESTAQWNLGVDFSVFNKLNGTLELYYKKTSDLLWTYPVPQPPSLVGTMVAHVGDLGNTGFELALGYKAVRTKDWTLDANMSLSYNKQEITKLSNDQYQAVGLQAGPLHSVRGMSNIYSQVIKEGYPAGAFWGPHCQGISEDGKYMLEKDADGKVKEGYLGSAMPKWNIGLSLNATWKNFDASVAAYGMFGQKVLNVSRMVLYDPTRFPSQNTLDDFMTSGITDNPTFSDYFIEKGDFFRLQAITLGYSLPLNSLKKLGLTRLRFYVTGENLFCITGYKGIDPEVSVPDNVLNSPGIDFFNSYPRPRTFSIGLNVGF